MLYEDDVVGAICEHLQAEGWFVISRCTSRQRGDDIVATRDGRRLVVECKGETSSDPHSNRFGEAFSRGQVYDHVAVGVLRALREVGRGSSLAAIGVPVNADHRRVVQDVAGPLASAGVGVFWVSPDRGVAADLPWSIDE